MGTKTHRSLRDIALDIRANWQEPYFGAKPYMAAMLDLDKPEDSYGADPATQIIAYFLSNAGTWRGDHARRIKLELKAML